MSRSRREFITAAAAGLVLSANRPIRPGGDRLDDTVLLAGEAAPAGLVSIRHTLTACALGAPSLSIPAGLSAEGLPVGIEIDGVPGSDDKILTLGRQIEQVWGPLPGPAGCRRLARGAAIP